MSQHDTPHAIRKPRIVVVLEGGLIQTILSDTADVEVISIDYDTEGAMPEDVTPIPQTADPVTYLADAYAHSQMPEVNAPRVAQLFQVVADAEG